MLILLASAGVLLSVVGISYALLGPALFGSNPFQQRVGGFVAETRRARKRVTSVGRRRKTVQEVLQEIDRAAKHRRRWVGLEERIEQAGMSLRRSTFIVLCFLCGIVCGGIALALTFSFLIAIGAGFIGVFGLPLWLLRIYTARHRKKIY